LRSPPPARCHFTQFFAGGPEERGVEVEQRRIDGDYAENLVEFEDSTTRWLCVSEGRAARCLEIPLEEDWGTDIMLDDGPKPTADELGSAKWAWTVGAKAGKLVFSVDSGEEQLGDLMSLVGERSLEEVGAHQRVDLTPLL
jgi:hypothetical protein